MAAKALLCVGPFGLEEPLRPDQQTTLPLLIDVLTIAIGLRECQTSQAQGEEQIKNFRRQCIQAASGRDSYWGAGFEPCRFGTRWIRLKPFAAALSAESAEQH